MRLPLSTHWVNSNDVARNCRGYEGQRSLAVLDDVLSKLRDAGIFALLDIHTVVHPEGNTGLWCGWCSSCTTENEQPIFDAWRTLAQRYCASHPNVLGADLFNEVRARARAHVVHT